MAYPYDPNQYPEYMPPDPGNFEDIGYQQASRSPGQHVMDFLSYFDRPRNALATAVRNVTDEDPNTGFLKGLWEGLSGQKQTSWTDVLGMRQAQSSDPWGEWLLRTGAQVGLDAVLDPTLLLGKVGTAARGTKAWQEASEKVFGSNFGRAILHGVPKHLEEKWALPYMGAMRGHNKRMSEYLDTLGIAKSLQDEIAQGTPGGVAALREMYERGSLQLNPELSHYYSQLSTKGDVLRDQINSRWANMTGTPEEYIKKVAEDGTYQWVPRELTDVGKRNLLSQPVLKPQRGVDSSRQLFRIVDPDELAKGNLVDIGDQKVVTKIDPRFGVTQAENGTYLWRDPVSGKQVKAGITQATLQDITDSGVLRNAERSFVQDPLESFAKNYKTKNAQEAWLEFAGDKIASPTNPGFGFHPSEIKRLTDEGKYFFRMQDLGTADDLPKGFKQLSIPGLEGYAAPKWAVNDLEKKAKVLLDPSTNVGKLEEIGSALLNTKLGQTFKDATTWWKSNVLGLAPGYYFGNLASNVPQQYLGGINPLAIPARDAQAAAVQLGKDGSVIDGFTNRALKEAFTDRGIFNKTWAMNDELGDTAKVGRVRDWAEGLQNPIAKALGQGAATVGEKIGKANKFMLENVGGGIEGNSRAAVAIDWLKKNVHGVPTDLDLDKAAMYANKAMIDYGAGTPLEANFLKQIVPFYSWARGITGRTLETALENPQKLANLGRATDAAFVPMDPYQRQISDPNFKESAPTLGFAGKSWDYWMDKAGIPGRKEGDRALSLGRFLPQGVIEQMTSRPGDFLLSSVNPWLKTPAELLANYSTFKDRPLDELAKGPLAGLYAPLTGDPYQLAGRETFGAKLPAQWDYLLTQMPGGRMLNTVNELTRATGAFEDKNKAETNIPEAIAWALTGSKFMPFDPIKSLERRNREVKKTESELERSKNMALRKGDFEAYDHYQKLLQDYKMNSKPKALGWVARSS